MASRERQVVWSKSAQLALDEVISYIAADSRANALRVLERALDTARTLSTLADRGRVVPEASDPAIRELFVFQYRLMYRVEANRVHVIAFVHGARDFAAIRPIQDDD